MWLIYELLYLVGWLVYLPRALWRRRLPHRGWSMRLGLYPKRIAEALKDNRSIWIHAVSVGEVLAARPLLKHLRTPACPGPIVLSTVTSGGFDIASHQMADTGSAV